MVRQIEEDSKTFDNIESRIAAYPDVEFEIVTYSPLHSPDKKLNDYAKLIKT